MHHRKRPIFNNFTLLFNVLSQSSSAAAGMTSWSGCKSAVPYNFPCQFRPGAPSGPADLADHAAIGVSAMAKV